MKVNCAALPTELLESELFGYEKGAFTGANGRKQGKFELASGGTIFLDEIGEMCPSLQAKLLQVLQDAEFTRLGGNQARCASTFASCVPPIVRWWRWWQKPEISGRTSTSASTSSRSTSLPLRERREEIPLSWSTRFSSRYCITLPPAVIAGLSQRLIEAMKTPIPFPGNVRELENMIKRIVVLESEESVLHDLRAARPSRVERREELDALLLEIEETAGEVPLKEVGKRFAQEVEKEAIEHMLKETGWNRKKAAGRLGISYKTLLQKIRDCQVDA